MLTSPCVEWTGARTKLGYGIARVGNTTTTAHRREWVKVNGAVPEGLELDHLCRNRLCVNVEHLELVTSSENNRRSPRWQVTECVRGHPLTGDNLYVRIVNGRPWRSCRTCRRMFSQAWEAKKKAQRRAGRA